MGAGRYPCPGATRAIDPLKKYVLRTGGMVRPHSLQEYRCASAENIPYPDNFFNKVVSRWSLGFCIWRRRAYQEIYRVLKPNGRVEVRLLWKDRRFKANLMRRLEEAGIHVYIEYKGVYTKRWVPAEGKRGAYCSKRLTEFIICGRKVVVS